jgi:transketolase
MENLIKIANTIRSITIDIVANAGSGHPGMPMGCAELLAYLYGEFMQYHPGEPHWINRDRLILSAGHGALGQFIPLHMAGYDISIEDLKKHRQGSQKASSHPLYNPTLGIETTTGADGYGIGNAVGIALGQKILAYQFYQEYQHLFDEKIIVIGGDGCFMEGISYEAAQLAGHFKLNNLIIIYDANKVSLDGYIEETCSTDYVALYQAMGFDVYTINGHDLLQIRRVIEPLRTQQQKPVLIIAETQIGRGLFNKQGTLAAHSDALDLATITNSKAALRKSQQSWYINPEIYDFFQNKHQIIKDKITLKVKKDPLQEDEILSALDQFNYSNLEQPGRFLSQEVLNHLAHHFPQIYSGSADSARSDGTWLKEVDFLFAPRYQGRNIKFGVREFAMAAISNGLAQTNIIIPVIGGFMAFSDYLKPALRFAGLMKQQVICSFSHDSIFLGEDGPTHQPVEQLAMFRATPNTLVIRPADSSEIKFAWIMALQHQGPTILALARQTLPHLGIAKNLQNSLKRGAYVVRDTKTPDVVLYASGSEVALALEVYRELTEQKFEVRVISVPCIELFDQQPKKYKKSILQHGAKISVSIEAAHNMPWHKFIGKKGIAISVDEFGLSDSSKNVADKFGFTTKKIVNRILFNI